MSDPPYTVQPPGPFVEVPYMLRSAWTTGGYTWDECVASNGLPDVVRARLPEAHLRSCTLVVRVWSDLAEYRHATGAPGVKVGRAWLGPTAEGSVRFLTGAPDTPIRVGQRGRWKW